jgi:hypothetical protein
MNGGHLLYPSICTSFVCFVSVHPRVKRNSDTITRALAGARSYSHPYILPSQHIPLDKDTVGPLQQLCIMHAEERDPVSSGESTRYRRIKTRFVARRMLFHASLHLVTLNCS